MHRRLYSLLQYTTLIPDNITHYYDYQHYSQQLMPKRKHAKSLSRSASGSSKLLKLSSPFTAFRSESNQRMKNTKVETLPVPVKSLR